MQRVERVERVRVVQLNVSKCRVKMKKNLQSKRRRLLDGFVECGDGRCLRRSFHATVVHADYSTLQFVVAIVAVMAQPVVITDVINLFPLRGRVRGTRDEGRGRGAGIS